MSARVGRGADRAEPAADRAAWRQATVALRYRDYRWFWFAALTSNTGGWMQSAAIPYVAFRLTGRNGGVGVTGFFQYIPLMLMGAIGGSLADRFDRRRLLVVTQLVQALFAGFLWWMMSSGRATTTLLAALAFLSGIAGGLNVPIWQSFVSQLVPREVLVNAITLNSTQFNAARALGTFLAGVVIAVWGAGTVFLVNALSFLAVVGVLAVIRPSVPGPDLATRPRVVADLVAGFRYVRSTPGIVACCWAILAIAGLCGPLFAYLTASYGQEVFRVEGWRAGLLWGAGGIGAILVAPVLLTVGETVARHRLLVVAMTAYAVATIGVGLSPTWWLAAAASVLYGGSYLAIASAINTTIQVLAREDMRGKSIAIYIMCLTGALPVGSVLWGWVADEVGIRAVTVGAGAALASVAALFATRGRFHAMAAADRVRAAL